MAVAAVAMTGTVVVIPAAVPGADWWRSEQ
jgi:hypothetical protein